jgi:hypothetical protein
MKDNGYYILGHMMKSGRYIVASVEKQVYKFLGLIKRNEPLSCIWDGKHWMDIMTHKETPKELADILDARRLAAYPPHVPLLKLIGTKVIVSNPECVAVGEIIGIAEYDTNLPIIKELESEKFILVTNNTILMPYSEELMQILVGKTWKLQYDFCRELLAHIRVLCWRED